MAIFTGKTDAGLPLVTQVMQVDMDNRDELLRLWRRATAMSNIFTLVQADPDIVWMEPDDEPVVTYSDAVAELETEHRLSDGGFDLTDFSRRAQEMQKPTREFLLDEFARCCTLTRKVVYSLFGGGLVPVVALHTLRFEAAKARLSLSVSCRDAGALLSQPDSDDGFVPLQDLSALFQADFLVPVLYLSEQVDGLLVDVSAGTVRLMRCPECQNIFVSDHDRRIYCSTRCSSRARMRRLREKKAA